mgnify:FL=1
MRRRRSAAVLAWAVLALSAALALVAAMRLAASPRAMPGAARRDGRSAGELAESLAGRLPGGAREETKVVEGEVAAVASGVLEEYAARGDCALAEAGYLGILGEVWGCVVYGGDWSEVCVVRKSAMEESEVLTWRIDAEELAGVVGD